ncbi:SRPBCC family protein [Salsipaludibacter albus]|uniref:SRPBCC family protein n=1 Tax=Salsipaludibacter albus TaxID=2849650 RepID=UPI001EE43BD1|nr:SRPBCC family protein [Salsipaludibacter albus]MBY5163068.1 SRPBCC family protein [Salsipaludibacter albus]
MEFTNTFTIPAGIDEAFATLTDLETVAPCMPGAKLESVDGDVYTGKVKVKVGPMSLTYRGTATVVDKDPEAHSATIEAKGNEARGGGTANADVSASLREVEDGTEVTVVTALNITGKPAQFGRGVMGDVGKKIIDAFADCLSRKLDTSSDDEDANDADAVVAGDTGATDGAEADEPTGTAVPDVGDEPVDAPSATTPAQASAAAQQAATASAPRRIADTEPEVEALDLMDVAGGSVAKRVVPVLGVAALVALVVWLFTRGGDEDA